MTKLEEFFEGVPIVDLHFLESSLLAEEDLKGVTTEDELERIRRQKVRF